MAARKRGSGPLSIKKPDRPSVSPWFPTAAPNPARARFTFPTCARDALAFLYYSRLELGQGRVTRSSECSFGFGVFCEDGLHRLRKISPSTTSPTVTDHILVSVKGPQSDFNFDVFYARDAARTPLKIRIPLSAGHVSRWSWCAEMRVAFFSPLPPARSGIADYSEALIESLRPLVDLKIFSAPIQLFDPSQFDIALYHIGNNGFHDFVYETALRIPAWW